MTLQGDYLPTWLQLVVDKFDKETSVKAFGINLIKVLRAHRTNKKLPLTERSVINYLTNVKKHLIRRGCINNPHFTQTVLFGTMQATGESDPESVKRELKVLSKFEQLDKYDQYRHWHELKNLYKQVEHIAGKFDRVLWSTEFFSLDWILNCQELSLEKYAFGSIKRLRDHSDKKLEEKLARNTFITETQEFLAFVLSGLYSPDSLGDMVCALALACGRRVCSFYINGRNFRRAGDKNEASCYYTERVKKRGPKQVVEIKIPLLCPWWLFWSCLNRFRRRITLRYGYALKTAQEVGAKRNWADNTHLKKRIGIDWKMKDLREVYVAAMLRIHASKLQTNVFVKAILGHENVKQSLNYTSLILDPLSPITQPVFPSEVSPNAELVQKGPRSFQTFCIESNLEKLIVSEKVEDTFETVATIDLKEPSLPSPEKMPKLEGAILESALLDPSRPAQTKLDYGMETEQQPPLAEQQSLCF